MTTKLLLAANFCLADNFRLAANFCLAGVICTLASAASASSLDVPAPVKLEATEFNEVLVSVGDDLFVSGQPSEQGLTELSQSGLTTVINLRTHFEMNDRNTVPFDEAALLESLGIDYVHIPSGGPNTPYAPEMVQTLAAAIDGAEGKVLIHCTVGWRASHLYTAYLHRYAGLNLADAVRHGQAINLGHLPLEGFLGAPIIISVADD